MKVDRNDLWVGLFSLIAFGTFAALLLLAHARRAGSEVYPIKIKLDSLDGVEEGTPVMLLGMRVGLVSSVSLVEKGVDIFGVAVLEIQADRKLWRGTRAMVVSQGVLSTVLELELPTPERRRELLRPWATLSGGHGQSIETLIAQAELTLQSFQDTANALRATTAQGLLDVPAVRELLTSLAELVRTYEALGRDARSMVIKGNRGLVTFDQALLALRRSTEDLDAMMRRREPDLERALVAVPKTLDETTRLMARVRSATEELEPETKTMLTRMERVLRDAEELIELLKQKPSRVIWGRPSEDERNKARRAAE